MKNRNLVFIVFLFITTISYSQTLNERPNASHYILPTAFVGSNACATLDVYSMFDTINDIYNFGRNVAYITQSTDDSWTDSIDTYDLAQPYYTDTTVTIVGISAYISNKQAYSINNPHFDQDMYMEIRDSSLNNILRKACFNEVYTYTSEGIGAHFVMPHYTELFFDSSINMRGKFYVVIDNPKVVISYLGYRCSFSLNIFLSTDAACNNTNMPLIRGHNHVWVTLDQWINNEYVAYKYSDLYLFPIYGELNVGLKDIDINKYSTLFPNPAENEVSVNCSFKINGIEVYNLVGQKLFAKEINAYNTTIDVSKYEKGSYIVKINTDKGVANKKFIKQ
jgi:hypothetical protein